MVMTIRSCKRDWMSSIKTIWSMHIKDISGVCACVQPSRNTSWTLFRQGPVRGKVAKDRKKAMMGTSVLLCTPKKRSEWILYNPDLSWTINHCCRFSFILFIQPHSQWFLTLRSKSSLISMELFLLMVKALYTMLFVVLLTKNAFRFT